MIHAPDDDWRDDTMLYHLIISLKEFDPLDEPGSARGNVNRLV